MNSRQVVMFLLICFNVVTGARFFLRHHPYVIVNPENEPQAPSSEFYERVNRAANGPDDPRPMSDVLHSLVFTPNLRRFTRNTNDLKRSEFQRTGGTILLG